MDVESELENEEKLFSEGFTSEGDDEDEGDYEDASDFDYDDDFKNE